MLRIRDQFIPLKMSEDCLLDQPLQNLAWYAGETNWAVASRRMAITRFINRCDVRLFPCCWENPGLE